MVQTIERSRDDVEQQAASGPRITILLSPYTLAMNRYIEMLKALLGTVGYEVAPLSVKGLLRGGFFRLFDRNTVLVFHWLEYRAFRKKNARMSLSLKGMLAFAFYCTIICIARARVVYFVHDQAVHDTVGSTRRVSARLIGLLRRLSHRRVVHAPDFTTRYDAHYLPHPLYWNAPGHAQPVGRVRGEKPVFAVLGVIRPYKDIAGVLSVWPHACRLEIAGQGSPDYLKTLHDIIERRALENDIAIDPRYLSDQEFDQRIDAADVLILPHHADSMLVSGAFFEAIGRVPVLISRDTPFMRWAAAKFDNVLLFEHIEELPEIVRSVARKWPDLADTERSARAIDEFGWAACCAQYRAFFDAVVEES